MKVLGIGEVTIDKVVLLERYPIEGSKVTPLREKFSLGGPVVSALILLSRLGISCSFIGSISCSKDGYKTRKIFKKEKITVYPGTCTEDKVNYVLVNKKNGVRTIVKSCNKSKPITNISEKLIKEADLIIMDRHEKKAFYEVLNKKRKQTGLIIDTSLEVNKETINMLKVMDVPIVPIEAIKGTDNKKSEKDEINKFYKELNKTIVITAGSNGSYIYNGKNFIWQKPLKIKVVDTLGAGDVFRGAFGWGLLNKWGLKKTVNFANVVSALQCKRLGNQTAIPSKLEILNSFPGFQD